MAGIKHAILKDYNKNRQREDLKRRVQRAER